MRNNYILGTAIVAVSIAVMAFTHDVAAQQAAPSGGVVAFKAGPVKAPAAGNPELVTVTPELIAAAKKEGQLALMYSGQQSTAEAVANAFGQQYGIKVSFNRQVGAAGTQAFATQERAGRHQTDVHITTDGAGFVKLINEGLVANYTVSLERPDIARMDGWGYASWYLNVVNSYNSKLVPLDQAKKLLTDWNGLLDPALKGGKLGMLKPSSATQSFLLFWMWMTTPEYGESFVRKLADQKPVFFEGSGPAREALSAGEISVLVGDNGVNTTESFLAGSDLNWQWPNLSPHWASNFTAISAHAPHPAAARLYAAWILGSEGAKAIQAVNETPTLKSATHDPLAVDAVLAKTAWWPGKFPDKTEWTFDKYLYFNPDFVNELIAKVDAIFGISG